MPVQSRSHCQGGAEGSLLTPHGQGARESQSHEAEALMLGAELNGSKNAWPVPQGGGGPQKKPFILFPTARAWSCLAPSPTRVLPFCASCLSGSPPPSLHNLLTYVPSLGESLI